MKAILEKAKTFMKLPVARGLFSLTLLALLFGGWFFWQIKPDAKTELLENGTPISKEIEERFGVRFTFLAVEARGGLVDLRYKVVDVGKAKNFGHYTETSPMIIDETTGTVVDNAKMGLHAHHVEPGRTYFILYRNTGNAIKSGSQVTIVMDDLRLENVPVQ